MSDALQDGLQSSAMRDFGVERAPARCVWEEEAHEC